jgi:hypothetical protein
MPQLLDVRPLACGRLMTVIIVLLACCSLTAGAGEDAVGIWNLKIGSRTVLLQVDRSAGGLSAKVSGPRRDLRPADRVEFDGRVLTVEYGAFTYALTVNGATVHGTVTSPSGREDVAGARQTTLMLGGDAPPAVERAWWGRVGARDAGVPPTERDPGGWLEARIKSPDDWVLEAWRTSDDSPRPSAALGTQRLSFVNARQHEAALLRLAGKVVIVTGTWKVDRIDIRKVEPAPADALR